MENDFKKNFLTYFTSREQREQKQPKKSPYGDFLCYKDL